VAIKILDKEKIKQEDLGESIKKEISFKNLLSLCLSTKLCIDKKRVAEFFI
jgi:uncharacterized protein YutE (UPF0331/DUF86 family)